MSTPLEAIRPKGPSGAVSAGETTDGVDHECKTR